MSQLSHLVRRISRPQRWLLASLLIFSSALYAIDEVSPSATTVMPSPFASPDVERAPIKRTWSCTRGVEEPLKR
jgi:hypothetical protein